MFNKIIEAIEEKRRQKTANDIYEILERNRENERQRAKDYFKNAMLYSSDLQKYVDEDERRTVEAIANGEKYWLWDTKDFISKLYFDAVEMCQVFPSYQFMALYVGFMAKHIEDEDVLYIFKHWYETGEIDYNKEILGRTPYLIADRHMEHPITALLEEYAIKTGQIPFPAYLKIEDIHNYSRTMNFGVRNKKPSEDGLHLIECSEYEYNIASGNEYKNLSYEELSRQVEEEENRILEKLRKEGHDI